MHSPNSTVSNAQLALAIAPLTFFSSCVSAGINNKVKVFNCLNDQALISTAKSVTQNFARNGIANAKCVANLKSSSLQNVAIDTAKIAMIVGLVQKVLTLQDSSSMALSIVPTASTLLKSVTLPMSMFDIAPSRSRHNYCREHRHIRYARRYFQYDERRQGEENQGQAQQVEEQVQAQQQSKRTYNRLQSNYSKTAKRAKLTRTVNAASSLQVTQANTSSSAQSAQENSTQSVEQIATTVGQAANDEEDDFNFAYAKHGAMATMMAKQ